MREALQAAGRCGQIGAAAEASVLARATQERMVEAFDAAVEHALKCRA